MSKNQLVWDQRRDATSAAHTAEVADKKEQARLRAQANRDKKKAAEGSGYCNGGDE